jgi:hypothetical protein
VYGSASVYAPIDNTPIPRNSDVTFDLEVVDCNVRAEKYDPKKYVQPVTTTMQPNTCFYLHLTESDSTGLDLVLSTQDEDYASWWPAK